MTRHSNSLLRGLVLSGTRSQLSPSELRKIELSPLKAGLLAFLMECIPLMRDSLPKFPHPMSAGRPLLEPALIEPMLAAHLTTISDDQVMESLSKAREIFDRLLAAGEAAQRTIEGEAIPTGLLTDENR